MPLHQNAGSGQASTTIEPTVDIALAILARTPSLAIRPGSRYRHTGRATGR